LVQTGPVISKKKIDMLKVDRRRLTTMTNTKSQLS